MSLIEVVQRLFYENCFAIKPQFHTLFPKIDVFTKIEVVQKYQITSIEQ
jgi:hypothetical protein